MTTWQFRSVRGFLLLMAMLFFAGVRGVCAQDSPASSRTAAPATRGVKIENPLNQMLEDAQRDIDKGEFEAAIAPLQKFIAEKPQVAYAHFQLAYAFTALKRGTEARAEYERAIGIEPKMAEAHLNLGILLLEADPAAAIPHLRAATELLPSQTRPRFLLGVALQRSGDMPGAIEAFEGASRLDPRDTESTVHLGDIFLATKRFADAEEKFRSALGAEPENTGGAGAAGKKDPRLLLGLAQALDAEEKKTEAAETFRKYLQLQPEDGAARARLVHLLVEQEQFDAALAELNRDGGGAEGIELLRVRAEIEIGQKKWDAAIATLRKAEAILPQDAELRGGLGRVYMEKRDFAAAEKELKAALALDGKNVVFWKDLGSVYYLSGNCPSALAVLDEVGKRETPGAGAWFIRALCYDKLNQAKPALEAYQKFLELDLGKNPDQVWQAQERSKVLKRMVEHKR